MTGSTEMSSEADAAAGTIIKKKTKDTKRQRRKVVNPSNTWPQQPRIQSSEARAKAYLRVAGLGGDSSSKTTKQQQELLDPSLDMDSPEMKFGRLLGGTNQRKRHETVKKLQLYLKARCDIQNEQGGISELDLLKLWKALWFTLYMADKVPVQDELSKRLAELIWCVAGTEEEDEYAGQAYMAMCGEPEESSGFGFSEDNDVIMEEVVNTLEESSEEEEEEDDDKEEEEKLDKAEEDHLDSDEEEQDDDADGGAVQEDDWNVRHCRGAHLASLFVKTFFRTIQREWGKMDKHRVDKFYTLIRLMMQQIYRYMAVRHWSIGIIRLFNDAIFEEVLSKTPNGLRYHLIDICLEELVRANAAAPMPLTEATFLDCMEPYFAMVQSVQDAIVQERVMNKVLLKFLEDHSVVSLPDEKDLEGNNDILDQVHVGSVAQFIFELASNEETRDRYRKGLYEMHKIYAKRLKKVGRDVVLDDGSDISLGMIHGEEGGDGADEVAEPEQKEDTPRVDVSKKKHKKEKKRKDRSNKEQRKGHETDQVDADGKEKSKKEKKRKERSDKEQDKEQEADQVFADGKQKSKKEKKRKDKEQVKEQEETDEVEVDSKEKKGKDRSSKEQVKERGEPGAVEIDGKGKKKKKKRKKKSLDQAEAISSTDNLGDEAPSKKKRRKKKEEMQAANQEEEEVVISYSEQKKAAKAAAEAEEKKQKSVAPETKSKKKKKDKHAEGDEKRRVSFGAFNRSKSHKASMKALKTTVPPSTSTHSPQRGILLKKGSRQSTGGIQKKARKQAVDYF